MLLSSAEVVSSHMALTPRSLHGMEADAKICQIIMRVVALLARLLISGHCVFWRLSYLASLPVQA